MVDSGWMEMLPEMVEAGGRGSCQRSDTESGFEHALFKVIRVTALSAQQDTRAGDDMT